MRKADKATLERLRGEHGELYAVTVEDVELIVRPPTREAFRRFTKRGVNDPFLAAEELVRDCVLWPDTEELDALLALRPGLITPLSEQLLRLAGAVQELTFRAI